MFQTIGWNNQKWLPRLKVIAVIVSSLIILLFVSTAVNAFIEANCMTASHEFTAPLLAKF